MIFHSYLSFPGGNRNHDQKQLDVGGIEVSVKPKPWQNFDERMGVVVKYSFGQQGLRNQQKQMLAVYMVSRDWDLTIQNGEFIKLWWNSVDLMSILSTWRYTPQSQGVRTTWVGANEL